MENFVLEIPNFLSKDLCEEIIDRFEKSDRKTKGSYSCWSFNKLVTKNKYNEQLNIIKYSEWKDVEEKIKPYIQKAIDAYYFHIFKNYDYDNQEWHPMDRILKRACYDWGYLIHKIKKGDRYEWHLDGLPRDTEFMQMIIYLNTVTKGGRTFLVSKEHSGVKPETGKLLVFPCSWTFPHSGEEVGNDAKYIISVILNAHPTPS